MLTSMSFKFAINYFLNNFLKIGGVLTPLRTMSYRFSIHVKRKDVGLHFLRHFSLSQKRNFGNFTACVLLTAPFYFRDQEFGIIKSFLDGRETDIYYKLRDCKPREFPRYRDKVEYTLITKKSNNSLYARDVSILEKHEKKFVTGYVCALKETFGFIESEDHVREIFFHYSELDGDPNLLELGDVVRYIETKKTDKRSAEKVSKCKEIFAQEDIPSKLYNGVVIRPMRIVDPEVRDLDNTSSKFDS